jgi:hypothetical protein
LLFFPKHGKAGTYVGSLRSAISHRDFAEPDLVKPLHKAAAKAIGEGKGRAAMGAGGDELKFTGIVNAALEGHGAGEYALGDMDPKENVSISTMIENRALCG